LTLSHALSLIEAAWTGSPELDAAIAEVLDIAKAPYTSSIDAAMQLIPDGWSIAQLAQRSDGRGNVAGWTAELFRRPLGILPDVPARVMASAPLALATAALRARLDQAKPLRAAA
jgi:hypothetical protein